jgi:membrane fusion protein, multidrug efflux system
MKRTGVQRYLWSGVAIAAVLVIAGAAWLRAPAKTAPPDPPPVPVTAAAVAQGDVAIERDALGRVQALNTVIVRAQVAGQVQKFTFEQGQKVTTGQLLAQIDPRPFQAAVEQDQAVIARDRANLANAKADLARYVPLVGKGLVSTQQVETQRAVVAQLEATIAADQAALAQAQVQLGYTSITAPIAGIAGLRYVDIGNVVSPNDAQGLVTINQVQPVSVLFAMPQAELPEIKEAAARAGKEGLAVEAWSENGTRKLDSGRLLVINNQVDATSGTVTLMARFPNAEELLWPGAFVGIRLVLGVQHDGLTVPVSALQQGPQGTYVWTLAGDGTVRRIPVAVQQRAHGRLLLSSGVSAGELVVTGGSFGLLPGTHVALTNAASPEAQGLRNVEADRLGFAP